MSKYFIVSRYFKENHYDRGCFVLFSLKSRSRTSMIFRTSRKLLKRGTNFSVNVCVSEELSKGYVVQIYLRTAAHANHLFH